MKLAQFGRPAALVAGAGALLLAGLPAQAVGGPSTAATAAPATPRATSETAQAGRDQHGYYDARQLSTKAAAAATAERLGARTGSAQAFTKSLGRQAVVDIDPLTGTPRDLGRLDGYLSGASSKPARQVALDYVRSHAADLGLTSADFATFHLARDYVDPSGLHNLSWTQSVHGVPVFGNGLKVKVTRDGRVLSVQGSPVSGLAALAAKAPAGTKLDAAQARTRSASDVGTRPAAATVTSARGAGTTTWKNNDNATKVWFLTPTGLRPGWSTYVTSGSASAYQHVIDAASGRVLFRRSTMDNEHGDATVYPYYPGAPGNTGKTRTINFIKRGWLSPDATFLDGTSVIAWADINDNNAISKNEKTPVPGTRKGAQFTLKHYTTPASDLCSAKFVCTWDPTTPKSWRVNRNADVTNAFYLANKYHDWLQNGPAQFTPQAGNFSANGADPVLLNALDGANTLDGLPDGNHIDNANMNTPPDGTPPTMQMYLWHQPGTTDDQDPFVPTSGAFDPSVLFHEYTHGLSNRLVVDADGNSTLNDLQAGSMGEAWSDYYAMDFLVRTGLVPDTAKDGEVFEGDYLVAHKAPFRTMAIDCPVGSTAPGCSTALDGTPGGYTYSDVPTIGGGPEVHSSGEVWAQTLWDIRKQFGSTLADELITRAMSLSADDPSMLDMRNAILQADLVGFDGKDTATLWKLFAARGMGYFAGTIDSADTTPADSFKTPPSPATARVSISGTVLDSNGLPVQGATVLVGGFGNQFSDVTAADGTYSINNLYAGTYQKVVVTAPGYFPAAKAVKAPSSTSGDFAITRDFAASTGGATIDDFNGPDYSPQCGPTGAIDLSLGTGWGSSTGDDNGTPTNQFVPKYIIVKLPTAVDISSFGVDPAATCGDGGSASTGAYSIQTSTNGVTYSDAASGTFTVDNRGHLNTITPAAGSGTGVQYVRFNILGNQTPDFATNCPNGAYSGCSYTDLSELAVFGAATVTN